ncbi:MAG: glycerol kinase GlpK [Rhodanobacteraceae bacterium]|nr:glycerol kinase GlpK [Rhodanobacteraceae bacterium]
MPLILALDQGTSSSRALLLDGEARVLASHSEAFDCSYPKPGWVEVDADLLWHTQRTAIRSVLAQAEAHPAQIDAIGITNQRETVVAWDRQTGAPLGPAIVWQCRRTEPFCADLRARGVGDEIRARTGLVVDPYFSASKMRWMLDQWPQARALAAQGRLCFGTVDSWLVWQLSGGAAFITDASNASRTMLYSLEAGDWDPWLLELFGIPRDCLPTVVDSAGRLAQTDTGVFGAEVPIAGIAGDQQAALFGQACFWPGMAKNTYGTGCFLLLNTGSERIVSRHGLLRTVAWQLGGARTYALEGAVFVAGALIQWLRDGLGLIGHAGESEALASSVADSAGVHVVPAFVGLGAPHWDADARGLICGLTRGSTRAHIVRAALEAVALQNVDLLDAMRADTGRDLAELRIDGGMSVNDLLCQFQADVLGVPVCRPSQTESTALGAGLLAGLGIGLWRNLDEVAARWTCARRFETRMDAVERGRHLAGWRAAVARARSAPAPA